MALLDSGGKDVVNIKSTAIKRSLEWDGGTCLHRFVLESYRIQQHTAVSCIERLVHEGANINEPTNAGLTPLHFACMESTPSIAITLLRLGADPTLKDDQGHTPLDIVENKKGGYISDNWEEFLELFQAHLKQRGLESTKRIATH